MNIEEARKNLKVGDRVRVDGYAMTKGGFAVAYAGAVTYRVCGFGLEDIRFEVGDEIHSVRPSSIIEVIPAEPKPIVGTWRCSREFTNLHEPSKGEYFICKNCKVYRTEGWSYNERLFGRNDRRTGDRRKK